MMRIRINGWFCKRWSSGRWYSFVPWPALAFDFIPGNHSAHVELWWLLWEGKLNVFWGPFAVAKEPQTELCENCDELFLAGHGRSTEDDVLLCPACWRACIEEDCSTTGNSE